MGFPGDAPEDVPPPAGPGDARPPAVATPAARPASAGWIPIRSLTARHRARILAHLLALDARDRYLRFGYAAEDEQIRRYVDHIPFDRDEVFGVFNRRLDLVALAHLACETTPDAGPDRPISAEFGVSVAVSARGRGYGARLFDHAVLRARNRHVDTIVIHALSENAAMLRIVSNAGALVEHSGGDSEARLKLPPENFVTRVELMVEEQAGELDYRLKQGMRRAEEPPGPDDTEPPR